MLFIKTQFLIEKHQCYIKQTNYKFFLQTYSGRENGGWHYIRDVGAEDAKSP